MTMLMLAAVRGHLPLVELLVSRGADVNKQEFSGFTALMLGCMDNNPDIVAHLLRAGARTDVRNREGNTVLELATIMQRGECERRACAGHA